MSKKLLAQNENEPQPKITALPADADAETMAAFIAELIRENHCQEELLTEAMDALEAVINDGLSFATEQSADRAIEKIKQALAK